MSCKEEEMFLGEQCAQGGKESKKAQRWRGSAPRTPAV